MFSPRLGVATKTVHIMWSCASAALLHQPFIRTNRFVSVMPASNQSKCLCSNDSSESDFSSTDSKCLVLFATRSQDKSDQPTPPPPKAMKVMDKDAVPNKLEGKQQSLFALVSKTKFLAEPRTSNCPAKSKASL